MSACDIRTTLRSTAVPRIPFRTIAERILGSRYELSVVLIGDDLSQRLNREHRGKDYPTNVLSFPLSENEGEIFINVRKAEREARMSDTTPRNRIAYLFIHGALHLKGLRHGATMERKETELLRAFNVKDVR